MATTVAVEPPTVTVPAQTIVANSAEANCLGVTSSQSFTLMLTATTQSVSGTLDLATGLVTLDLPLVVVEAQVPQTFSVPLS